ncbi:MAG: hypothetical protein JXA13_11200 [Anaerolineales bacterium]|nr:hypothetical protein [Anaerolineales bacterium]
MVAVYNNLEAFYPFLCKGEDGTLFEKRKYRGDRGLFWLGKDKLLFATTPVPPGIELWKLWGYEGTEIIAPQQATHQLSLDILREPALVQRILDYSGEEQAVQLVPYATTSEFLELTEKLRSEYGLTVYLPESPCKEDLWLRDYIDKKTGFRTLVSQWVCDNNLFPFGLVSHCLDEAADAVLWFLEQGRSCVVKADSGESGIGHLVFNRKQVSRQDVLKELVTDPFLQGDVLIVEEHIQSSKMISPSLELFVPPLGEGLPEITYLSNQLFEKFGRFAGVLVSKSILKESWYPRLAEYGMRIAAQMQEMGYIGFFDLDTIVDDDGRLYLLEINARRTGGTYVHEFALQTFGADYINHVVLLCNNAIECPGVTDTGTLLEIIGDLRLVVGNSSRGLVVTVTSTLPNEEFGCIFIAPTEDEVLALKEELLDRINAFGVYPDHR